ncbi:hypothetical protein [Rubinisphaera margarita]|nr:hypothetical protein [Rubinisphaera margarita]
MAQTRASEWRSRKWKLTDALLVSRLPLAEESLAFFSAKDGLFL